MRLLHPAWIFSVLAHGSGLAAVFALDPPLQPRRSAIVMEVLPRRAAGAPPAAVESPRPPLAQAPAPSQRRALAPRAKAPPPVAPPPVAPPPAAPLVAPPVAAATGVVTQPVAAATAPPAAPTSAPGAARSASAGAAGGAGAAGADLSGYLGVITRAVAARKRYPALALELALEGEIQVLLRLHPDGSLAAPPRIVRSSGEQLLDAEALRMVAQASPFPPLPANQPGAVAELRLPIRFRLAD